MSRDLIYPSRVLMSGQAYVESRGEVDPISYTRFQELSKVWGRVVQFEIDFWDMGMRGERVKSLRQPCRL